MKASKPVETILYYWIPCLTLMSMLEKIFIKIIDIFEQTGKVIRQKLIVMTAS